MLSNSKPREPYYMSIEGEPFELLEIYTKDQQHILAWEFIVHKRLTRFPLNKSALPKVSIGDEIIRERGK